MQFQLLLKSETWGYVYKDNDTNNKSDSFLHTFLNIFEASFPIKYRSIGKVKSDLITQEVKISCKCVKGFFTPTAGTVTTQTQRAFYIKHCILYLADTGEKMGI
jgi:hypothetical protein